MNRDAGRIPRSPILRKMPARQPIPTALAAPFLANKGEVTTEPGNRFPYGFMPFPYTSSLWNPRAVCPLDFQRPTRSSPPTRMLLRFQTSWESSPNSSLANGSPRVHVDQFGRATGLQRLLDRPETAQGAPWVLNCCSRAGSKRPAHADDGIQ